MNNNRRVWSFLVCGLAIVLASGFSSRPLPVEDFDRKLEAMGLELPPVSEAVGIYRPVVVVDNMAWLSGHIPRTADGEIMRGKAGGDVTLQRGQQAARQCGLAMLASLKAELGSLNRVRRLVKTTGMVNCTPDFVDQPKVVNGCSELFRDLFGEENGVGARAAVGMASLPAGAIVEIEAVFEIEPEQVSRRSPVP